MSYRFILILWFLLSASTASGSPIYPLPGESLEDAACKMAQKDYSGVVSSALCSPESGIRDLLIGIALFRMDDLEKASQYLEKASISFPLLADYAIYHRARALYTLRRYADSLTLLNLLVKSYPDFPFCRQAEKLIADILSETGEFRQAIIAYQRFLDRYPSGSDSLDAKYSIARYREELGETSAAAAGYRKIWLEHPYSSVAEKAASDMQRLSSKGVNLHPFSAEELFSRGNLLFDQGKYDRALREFQSIPLEGLADGFVRTLTLKKGKAGFRARRYMEAEKTFNELLATNPGKEVADEAMFWLGKTMDKMDREDDACILYESLADNSPGSALAERALLAASFVRRFQNRRSDSISILKKLTSRYPGSPLLKTAYWEIGWQSYVGGDLKGASDYLSKLLDDGERREKALYWYGRTLEASGDRTGANKAFAALKAEYPFGYYALAMGKGIQSEEIREILPDVDLRALFPVPTGFERPRALIALGLYDEARKELSLARRRIEISSAKRTAARLYLEMEDFRRLMALAPLDGSSRMEKNAITDWCMAFPPAFRELIKESASVNNVPVDIVSSIIRAESNYYPAAVSPAGAVGLMQLMPSTAAAIEGSGAKPISERLKIPELNIRYGVRHFKDLMVLYEGDIVMAVAAYNAGSGNVGRWIRKYGKMPSDIFIENIPFPETREYVKKVLSGAEIYRRLYGVGRPQGPNGKNGLPSNKETLP